MPKQFDDLIDKVKQEYLTLQKEYAYLKIKYDSLKREKDHWVAFHLAVKDEEGNDHFITGSEKAIKIVSDLINQKKKK